MHLYFASRAMHIAHLPLTSFSLSSSLSLIGMPCSFINFFRFSFVVFIFSLSLILSPWNLLSLHRMPNNICYIVYEGRENNKKTNVPYAKGRGKPVLRGTSYMFNNHAYKIGKHKCTNEKIKLVERNPFFSSFFSFS